MTGLFDYAEQQTAQTHNYQMSDIERGWEICKDAIEFEIRNLYCPDCGASLVWMQKQENGQTFYKERCGECGHMQLLPHTKNAKLRTNTTIAHWSDRVRGNAHYTCYICGKQSRDNEAHHIIQVAKLQGGEEYLRYADSNGICLCKECHKKVHRK